MSRTRLTLELEKDFVLFRDFTLCVGSLKRELGESAVFQPGMVIKLRCTRLVGCVP